MAYARPSFLSCPSCPSCPSCLPFLPLHSINLVRTGQRNQWDLPNMLCSRYLSSLALSTTQNAPSNSKTLPHQRILSLRQFRSRTHSTMPPVPSPVLPTHYSHLPLNTSESDSKPNPTGPDASTRAPLTAFASFRRTRVCSRVCTAERR